DLELLELRLRDDAVPPAAGPVVLLQHQAQLTDVPQRARHGGGLVEEAPRERIAALAQAGEVVVVALQRVDALPGPHDVSLGEGYGGHRGELRGVLLGAF